jgi:tetratricopeptide (TPR) repeat protein
MNNLEPRKGETMLRLFSTTILMFLSLPSILSAEEPADLKATMKKNFDALMNLQPYVADPNAFSDPKNRDAIQKNLDSMSGLKHVFPLKMSEQEPGLAAISSLFSDYLRDIQKSFRNGANGSFLRNQIRTMTGFCLSCHTRVSADQSFTDAQHKVDTASLTEFQRAEFYAATRQFDKALAAFEKIIAKTPPGDFGYIEFGRTVREALSIAIRVKQDVDVTSELLNKLARREDLPDFFKRYVAVWKEDVAKWKREKKSPKAMTSNELMAKAVALVDHAKKRQLFPVDPAGDINYLRATNYIHEAMQKEPKGAFRGEALYLLGSCYDSLQDPLLWALDSLYFEACVREFPHTDVSKKCYRRYAAKLYFGYSGSGGTFVPEDEIKKLTELQKLSQ